MVEMARSVDNNFKNAKNIKNGARMHLLWAWESKETLAMASFKFRQQLMRKMMIFVIFFPFYSFYNQMTKMPPLKKNLFLSFLMSIFVHQLTNGLITT